MPQMHGARLGNQPQGVTICYIFCLEKYYNGDNSMWNNFYIVLEYLLMFCRNCGEPMNDNQAICLKCGVETGKGDRFCPNCGASVAPDQTVCLQCGVALQQNKVNPAAGRIAPRNIVVAVLLSLVTCGIYGIYWFIVMTNEMNALTGHDKDTPGGLCFLLGLVTCGIYTYYWAYKMGEKKDELTGSNSSSSILFLVLALLGFGIVDYVLAQDAINKAVS